MRKAARAALFLIPPIAFFLLYRYALRAWFQQDDFAWLSLRSEVHNWHDLLNTLFQPKAQGTIRPWSERAFFLLLYDRFGLDHRAFHAVVAATMLLNLALLQHITARLTRSSLAGLAAPLLWLASTGLATPLSWLSSYNQIQCAFFILAALAALLQAIETGRARWWYLQLAIFVLGFGSLEVNIVYPALALALCLVHGPAWFKRTLALLPVSALYAAIHFTVARKPTSGPYAQHWDLSIFKTLWTYTEQALSGGNLWGAGPPPPWQYQSASALLAVALIAAAALAWRRGHRLPAFGLFFFCTVLAPILPLRDHVSAYYLAIPAAGLALAAAATLHFTLSHHRRATALVLAAIALHLAFTLPMNRRITRWHWERGLRIRSLVEGLERAHQLHPNQLIVVSGLDSDLYWSGYIDKPFRLFDLTETCLAPGSEAQIEAHPELADLNQSICPAPVVVDAARSNRLAVYQYEGPRLRNITRKFIRRIPTAWLNAKPAMVDVGQPAYARHLGTGWHEIQGGFRWMARHASLTLAAPAPGQSLYIEGFCPKASLNPPLRLTVKANGQPIGQSTISEDNSDFQLSYTLPPSLAKAAQLDLTLEVDRSVSPPNETRELALVIGKIGLR